MDFMRACVVLMAVASALMASCATSPDAQQRELLVGQWRQQIHVLGAVKTSDWFFSADGRYELTGYSDSRGMRASHVPEHGAWTLTGNTLELRQLPAAEPGQPAPQPTTEVRRIVKLTAEEFVTADTRFGIELAYSRVRAQ
jgi:hypothetical protein